MTNGAAVIWQIVPRISDNPDGVTDYAFNLANALWANHGLRTVFAPGKPSQASKKGEFETASITDAGARHLALRELRLSETWAAILVSTDFVSRSQNF